MPKNSTALSFILPFYGKPVMVILVICNFVAFWVFFAQVYKNSWDPDDNSASITTYFGSDRNATFKRTMIGLCAFYIIVDFLVNMFYIIFHVNTDSFERRCFIKWTMSWFYLSIAGWIVCQSAFSGYPVLDFCVSQLMAFSALCFYVQQKELEVNVQAKAAIIMDENKYRAFSHGAFFLGLFTFIIFWIFVFYSTAVKIEYMLAAELVCVFLVFTLNSLYVFGSYIMLFWTIKENDKKDWLDNLVVTLGLFTVITAVWCGAVSASKKF